MLIALVSTGACADDDRDDPGSPAQTGDQLAADDPDDRGTSATPGPGATPDATCSTTAGDVEPVDGPSATVEPIGEADGVSVAAAVYPLPDTEGDPWSQWGQGVVLPDGRFISAVGDHLGQDGTSWFYEYDPDSGELTRTAEVGAALGHRRGDWGYGKVHAPMFLGPCNEVITASYWGTRRNLVVGGSYRGDHLLRYDPVTHQVASLGVPIEGFGIPSIAVSADRRWIFGEAVDSASDVEADAGAFFVADAETGEVVHREDDPDHVGFRTVMVSAAGEALYAAAGGDLFRYAPGTDASGRLDGVLPGEWLRSSTPVAPDGSVYGATREPDELFKLDASGEVTDLGPADGYAASLGMSPDGRTLYYVPDAHGGAWTKGAPLMAVDTTTGHQQVVLEVNDMVERAFSLRAGGTYNVVVDPGGERVYIGMNAGPVTGDDEEEVEAFGQVVLLVVDLP